MGILTDYKPRTDIAIIATDVGKAMFLAAELPKELDHRFRLALVGMPLYGELFTKAYASLDLAPEVRSDYEDRWLTTDLNRCLVRGVEVTYVDL
jgi:hypothetical protein